MTLKQRTASHRAPGHCLPTALALTLCLAASCGGGGDSPAANGGDYALTQPTPYPEHLTAGDHVRTIVVRSETRAGTGPTRAGTVCHLTTLLFDVAGTGPLAPTTIDAASGCRLYNAATPESQYDNQHWICAGQVSVTGGGSTQGVGLCPTGSRPPVYDSVIPCGVVTTGGFTVSAVDSGVPGAVLTDLNAPVTLPDSVIISAPSDLPTTTWPASGDLPVVWNSAGATSAVVRLDAQGTGGTSVIVCTPTRNGRVVIPGSMIDQAAMRMRDTRLLVTSVKDTFTTAEGGMRYRVSGATATSVVLQGLH